MARNREESGPIEDAIREGVDEGMSNRAFRSMLEQSARFQFRHNQVFRNWCRSQRWNQKQLPPALPIVAFREANVRSFPKNQARFYFESSGTTVSGRGMRSRHEYRNLDLYRLSVIEGWKWQLREREESDLWHRPFSWIALMPSFDEAPTSSLSCMLQMLMKEFKGGISFWAMKKGQWDWVGLSKLLRQFEVSGQWVVMFGTAFGWVHFLDGCDLCSQKYILPRGSHAIETGGYKGRSRELSREALHEALHRKLGIPRSKVYSEYSMCELSSQAYSFSRKARGGKPRLLFRFPPWCRVRVVEPLTRRECPVGKRGVLEVADLANFETCSLIRTEDMAIAHREGFELVGRVPQSGLKGCSLQFERAERL